MNYWDEDELEKFVRANKDKFDVYQPDSGHQQQFLKKLLDRFREIVSIVPYLVKVGVATLLIFILSFFVWKLYLCPPLTHISLKYWRVEHNFRYHINRSTKLIYSYINNQEDSIRVEARLQKFDDSYNMLKKQLKKNPSPDNITKMLGLYKEKLLSLEEEVQTFRNKTPLNK
jgi:hypothetical protein